MKRKWKDLRPEDRTARIRKMKQVAAANRAERMRLARKAWRHRLRQRDFHRLAPNPDGTYRCLTCLTMAARGG